MVDQLKDSESEGTRTADHQQPADLPRRSARKEASKEWNPRQFEIPNEKRTLVGTTVFKTRDQQLYARLENGVIRRATPKVHGRDAKRARRHG